MKVIELICQSCNRTRVLDAKEQQKILAELIRPAQTKIIGCACGHFQFILAAGVRMAH